MFTAFKSPRRRALWLASAETESYGASLNVSGEIDLWGRLGLQTEAAREDWRLTPDDRALLESGR